MKRPKPESVSYTCVDGERVTIETVHNNRIIINFYEDLHSTPQEIGILDVDLEEIYNLYKLTKKKNK